MANKMWKDSEADLDLLNFNYLAEQVVEIAKDEELSPATIGIQISSLKTNHQP